MTATRFNPRVGLVSIAPVRPHKNTAPFSATSVRLDNVSDRAPRNTPKPKDMLDVIERACFKFVKNTRAPK